MAQKNNRTKNSMSNVKTAVLCYFIILLLNLFSKRAILDVMGTEYMGIQGLFGNIFSLLTFADLGLQSVMCVMMYKPLAEENEVRIRSLFEMFKKGFAILTTIAFFIGLIAMPSMQYVVNSELPMWEIYVYYMMFLIATTINNASRVRVNLFIASQRKRFVHIGIAIFDGLSLAGGIAVVYLFENYWLFCLMLVLRAIGYNFFFRYLAKKDYPFLQKNSNVQIQEINKEEGKKVRKDFLDMLVYKLTALLLNSTDNLFLSGMVGTVYVGIYSNYQMIVFGISEVIRELFDSISASVGNYIVMERNKKGLTGIFEIILSGANWLIGVTCICLYLLMQDFVIVCFGKHVVITNSVMLLLVINYFLTVSMMPVTMLRETSGLFHEMKAMAILRATLNIVLSAVFGYFWGAEGIFFATTLSILVTTFWYEPYIVYRKVIGGIHRYILWKVEGVVSIIIAYCLFAPIMNRIVVHNIIGWFGKALLCFILCAIYFGIFVVIHKETFAKMRGMVSEIFSKKGVANE